MNYTELMKQLSENIIRAVRSLIKTAPYDQTYKAKITEVVSATKVKIELNRQIHTATTSVSCEVGDIVIVCVPRNNWNDLYVEQNKTRGRASGIVAIDESGLLGSAGKSVNAQKLINVIADKVATKLLLKSDVVSQIVNDATKAASMAALYAVDQKVDKVNSDFLTKKFELANRVPIASGVRVAISVPFTIPTGYDVVSISAYSGSQNVDTSLAYYSSTEVRVMATNKSKTEYECPMVVLAVFRRK